MSSDPIRDTCHPSQEVPQVVVVSCDSKRLHYCLLIARELIHFFPFHFVFFLTVLWPFHTQELTNEHHGMIHHDSTVFSSVAS